MKASGIDMDKVNVALPFIHGVDSRFTTTKRVMLMTREAQSLTLPELAGKFAMEERDTCGSKPKDKAEASGTALKLKHVFKLMNDNVSDEDMDDPELVLLSSMVKRFIRKGPNSRSNFKKDDPKEAMSTRTEVNYSDPKKKSSIPAIVVIIIAGIGLFYLRKKIKNR